MFTDSQKNIFHAYGKRITAQLRDGFAKSSASGKLMDSIGYEVDDNSLHIYADEHLYYADKGRGPGKFPPRKAIIDWIKAKKLDLDIPIDSLAFLIQRKIAEQGTNTWQRDGENIVERVMSDELMDEITEAIANDAAQSATSEILKAFKITA